MVPLFQLLHPPVILLSKAALVVHCKALKLFLHICHTLLLLTLDGCRRLVKLLVD